MALYPVRSLECISKVACTLATERLRDAGLNDPFVHFQNTILVASEGVPTTEFKRAATCVKTKISNMQIADGEWVPAKCTKCTQKKYDLWKCNVLGIYELTLSAFR